MKKIYLLKKFNLTPKNKFGGLSLLSLFINY